MSDFPLRYEERVWEECDPKGRLIVRCRMIRDLKTNCIILFQGNPEDAQRIEDLHAERMHYINSRYEHPGLPSSSYGQRDFWSRLKFPL